jgi:hypothetical protein
MAAFSFSNSSLQSRVVCTKCRAIFFNLGQFTRSLDPTMVGAGRGGAGAGVLIW